MNVKFLLVGTQYRMRPHSEAALGVSNSEFTRNDYSSLCIHRAIHTFSVDSDFYRANRLNYAALCYQAQRDICIRKYFVYFWITSWARKSLLTSTQFEFSLPLVISRSVYPNIFENPLWKGISPRLGTFEKHFLSFPTSANIFFMPPFNSSVYPFSFLSGQNRGFFPFIVAYFV